LVGSDLIPPDISGDDLRGEFGRLLVGHFRVPQLDRQPTIPGQF
jgi:hypothetical protein